MSPRKKVRVVTINVNGIRAAFRNGMADWLAKNKAEIIALQEVRASDSDIDALFAQHGGLAKDGGIWHILHDGATAKGRAGVALVSLIPAKYFSTTLGPKEFDSAGRWLEGTYEFNGKELTVISCYVHSGEVDTPKQVEKYKFLDAMTDRMSKLMKTRELVVVVGDLNVGHTELDIKNWKGNLKNAGFLPKERAYFDTMMQKQGWVDIGRATHPNIPGPYTWWSFRGKAFDTDAGWRIDYQLATPKLAALSSNYQVHRAESYDSRWSDHSPVSVEYAI